MRLEKIRAQLAEIREGQEEAEEAGSLEELGELRGHEGALLEELFLAVFEESPVVSVDLPGDRTRYLVLHESAKKAGHWQISAFYSDGPFTDITNRTQEGVIREVPEMLVWPTSPESVTPMDPADFDAMTQTDEWHQGILRLRFITLDNLIRHRFGYSDEVMAVARDARDAVDEYGVEEGVKVLEAGMRVLKKRRRKKSR